VTNFTRQTRLTERPERIEGQAVQAVYGRNSNKKEQIAGSKEQRKYTHLCHQKSVIDTVVLTVKKKK